MKFCFITSIFLYYIIKSRISDHNKSSCGREFLENSAMFNNTQIILLNIVLVKRSRAQNVQIVHQGDFGKVRYAKHIKSTRVYDKWY